MENDLGELADRGRTETCRLDVLAVIIAYICHPKSNEGQWIPDFSQVFEGASASEREAVSIFGSWRRFILHASDWDETL